MDLDSENRSHEFTHSSASNYYPKNISKRSGLSTKLWKRRSLASSQRGKVWDKASNVLLVVELCSRKAWRLKSIGSRVSSVVQVWKERERGKLTTAKLLGFSPSKEKVHIRADEPVKFYFLEEGGNQTAREVDSKANNIDMCPNRRA